MVGKLVLTLVVALLLMGCSPTPKAVEKIVEQTRVVLQTVEVPQTVVVQETVLVLQTVVVQETVWVVVTATPIPDTPTPEMTATSTKQPTLTKPPTPTKPPTRTPIPPTATRTPRPPTPQPTKEGLSAGVRHNISHEQMIITNNNKYAWNDVTMEINSGILTRGYAYKIRRVEPGVTLTISVLEFTKSNGTRFNPFATKIVNFSINCDEGYWYSER